MARLSLRTTQARIGALTAVMAAVTLALAVRAVSVPTPGTPHHALPWWGVSAAYLATELCVMHFSFRREVHTYSMTETALVLGLVFASPRGLLIGQAIGCAVALIWRRQSPFKFLFNMVQFSLGTTTALVCFQTIANSSGIPGPRLWSGCFVAALTAAIVMSSAVVGAISLSERELDLSRVPMVLTLTAVNSGTNCCVSLVAATLVHYDRLALALLAGPAAIVSVSYRAYMREREKHESLQFLYRSSRLLSEAPQAEDAITGLLTQGRIMFKAETAAVALSTFSNDDPVVGTVVDKDDTARPMPTEVTDVTVAVWHEIRSGGQACRALRASSGDPITRAFLDAWGLRDAMVGLLHGERTNYGLLILGNRLGEIAPFDEDDLQLFATLVNHASVAFENGRLEQSLSQLRELEQRLKYLAYHDALTGLPNRSLFAERVEESLQSHRADDSSQSAVIFVDLDDFKTVNDTLGHAAGDALLCAVAERLTGCLRPGDTAARLGGDEFAVLLEGVDGAEEATGVAERIIRALREPVPVGTQDVLVGASIGIAPSGGYDSADELLRNADMAMYMAKYDGKGSFRLFEASMATEVSRRHRLKADLARGIGNGEFVPHFQPIVDLATGRTVAVEALARWEHPEQGTLAPEEFIPLAEETGLIADIERVVVRQACRAVAAWQAELDTEVPLTLTVNLSPTQLRRHELVSEIAESVATTKLAAGSLILEITESAMLDDAGITLERLRQLRALGIRLAVDDFGTGYSSLDHLRRFPVDVLKVPKTFVDELDNGVRGSAFAQAILTLANTLGLTTVAEGVESARQVAELRRLGCARGQGFFFARPMTSAEATRHLHEANADDTGTGLAAVIPLNA